MSLARLTMSLSDKQIKAIALNAEMCAQDAQFQGLGLVLESAQEVLEQADSDERAIQDAKSAIEASDQEFSSPALEALRICIKHFEKINGLSPSKRPGVESSNAKSNRAIALESVKTFLITLWENVKRAISYVWGKIREFFKLLLGKKEKNLGDETLRLTGIRKDYDRFLATEKEFLEKTIGVELIQSELHKSGDNTPEVQRSIAAMIGRVDPGHAAERLKEVQALFKEISEVKQTIEAREFRLLSADAGCLDEQIEAANDTFHGIFDVIDFLYDQHIRQRVIRATFQRDAMERTTDHGPAKKTDAELIEYYADDFKYGQTLTNHIEDLNREKLCGTTLVMTAVGASIERDGIKSIHDLGTAQKYSIQIEEKKKPISADQKYASGKADFYQVAHKAGDVAKEYTNAIADITEKAMSQDAGLSQDIIADGLDDTSRLISKFDGENPKDPFHATFSARARVIIDMNRAAPNLMFAATNLLQKGTIYHGELLWLIEKNYFIYKTMVYAMRVLKEVDLMTKGALSK
jgi:hypothetical protein